MIFIDCETVPVVADFTELDPRGQELFRKRFQKEINDPGELISQEKAAPHVWQEKASMMAEFARVLCVSMGFLKEAKVQKDGETIITTEFRIKSIAERNENLLLAKVAEILLKEEQLAGHNIKEFDLPFLFRRMIINNIPIPRCLQIEGKKPWEIPHKDTMEMWACGDFRSKISLDRLAYALGLASPKQDISGADVAALWYSEPEKEELPFDRDDRVLARIKRYCAGDVLTTANSYFRMKGLPLIAPEQVTYID